MPASALTLQLGLGFLVSVLHLPIGLGFRVRPKRKSAALKQQEHKAGADAEWYDYGDYGGPIHPLPSVCVSNWTDSMKFDCQLYEGAGWCEFGADYQLGAGWCSTHNLCDRTRIFRGGYALYGSQAWGWGTFYHFKSDARPTTAQQSCRGCGSRCPAETPKRQLNPIAEGCIDFSAPNGKAWRGSAGYTCGAYHHGGFCIKKDGKWVPGELMEGYGALEDYAHWAMNGTDQVKMSPLQACCTCGGGSTCTNGWKPPSECAREFVYQGKLFSGCTKEGSGNGVAWCSHNYKFTRTGWSNCGMC